MARKRKMKFKETQVTEPQGRAQIRQRLERVIEAEEAPEGAVQVPDETPVSDWAHVGEEN
jgi:hypothetical protein